MTKIAARYLLLTIVTAGMAVACGDPLLAPVASTISVFAADQKVSPGGSTEVAAVVREEAGTAVHDGTLVRFSATLGRVDPVESETVDGVARTTFTAGATAGAAKVTAMSGAAAGGDAGSNVVEITIE